MSEHAKLSASGSKKWLNCPLSIELESQFPQEESVYAKEGTTAHSLGELKIKTELGRISRADYIKERNLILKGYDNETIQELDRHTDDYKDFVIESYNKALSVCNEAEILIEERLDYSKYAEGGFGTGDIVISDFETIEIIDLKYGKGVKVDSFENSQLMLYGLGSLELYGDLFNIKSVKLTVYQPRLDNITSYEISAKDLIEWGEKVVIPRAEKALNSIGECVYGSHCDEGFCKARPICRTYNEQHLKVVEYEKKHPSLLTDDELVNVYEIATTHDKWLSTVKSYILTEMLNGKKLPGLKLVAGKSIRSFTDEKQVIKSLKENGFKKGEYIVEKLISVTTAEKLLGKQKFQDILGELVHKPLGSPTIAKMEDKRPEYNSAELDFADVEV